MLIHTCVMATLPPFIPDTYLRFHIIEVLQGLTCLTPYYYDEDGPFRNTIHLN